jgi:hypothetical protein
MPHRLVLFNHNDGTTNQGGGNMTATFEANGKAWKTDEDTLNIMREYRNSGNSYMVAAVFEIGVACGRIVQVAQ